MLLALKMTVATYRLACLSAKPRLAKVLAYPTDLNGSVRPDVGGVGVYIACTADMRVSYVGSVHRPVQEHGLSDRINEHRTQNPAKRSAWRYVWFVPMHHRATRAEVRLAEAQIGTMLRPPMTRRLPRG